MLRSLLFMAPGTIHSLRRIKEKTVTECDMWQLITQRWAETINLPLDRKLKSYYVQGVVLFDGGKI